MSLSRAAVSSAASEHVGPKTPQPEASQPVKLKEMLKVSRLSSSAERPIVHRVVMYQAERPSSQRHPQASGEGWLESQRWRAECE